MSVAESAPMIKPVYILIHFQVNIYLFKVNNKNTRTMW